MSWIRLDDGFASHPKIAALTHREFRIWVRTLCYCGRIEDPSVDRITIKEVPGLTPKIVSKLERLSLLDRSGNTHEIHDWVAYQPKDKTGAERQANYRARRQEQADPARYETVTPTVTESVTPAVTETLPRARDAHARTRPVPSPVVQENPFLPTEANYADDPDIDLSLPEANGQTPDRWNTPVDLEPISNILGRKEGFKT